MLTTPGPLNKLINEGEIRGLDHVGLRGRGLLSRLRKVYGKVYGIQHGCDDVEIKTEAVMVANPENKKGNRTAKAALLQGIT